MAKNFKLMMALFGLKPRSVKDDDFSNKEYLYNGNKCTETTYTNKNGDIVCVKNEVEVDWVEK